MLRPLRLLSNTRVYSSRTHQLLTHPFLYRGQGRLFHPSLATTAARAKKKADPQITQASSVSSSATPPPAAPKKRGRPKKEQTAPAQSVAAAAAPTTETAEPTLASPPVSADATPVSPAPKKGRRQKKATVSSEEVAVPQTIAAATTETGADVAHTEPKKKRGRPKKQPVSKTDNTDKETHPAVQPQQESTVAVVDQQQRQEQQQLQHPPPSQQPETPIQPSVSREIEDRSLPFVSDHTESPHTPVTFSAVEEPALLQPVTAATAEIVEAALPSQGGAVALTHSNLEKEAETSIDHALPTAVGQQQQEEQPQVGQQPQQVAEADKSVEDVADFEAQLEESISQAQERQRRRILDMIYKLEKEELQQQQQQAAQAKTEEPIHSSDAANAALDNSSLLSSLVRDITSSQAADNTSTRVDAGAPSHSSFWVALDTLHTTAAPSRSDDTYTSIASFSSPQQAVDAPIPAADSTGTDSSHIEAVDVQVDEVKAQVPSNLEQLPIAADTEEVPKVRETSKERNIRRRNAERELIRQQKQQEAAALALAEQEERHKTAMTEKVATTTPMTTDDVKVKSETESLIKPLDSAAAPARTYSFTEDIHKDDQTHWQKERKKYHKQLNAERAAMRTEQQKQYHRPDRSSSPRGPSIASSQLLHKHRQHTVGIIEGMTDTQPPPSEHGPSALRPFSREWRHAGGASASVTKSRSRLSLDSSHNQPDRPRWNGRDKGRGRARDGDPVRYPPVDSSTSLSFRPRDLPPRRQGGWNKPALASPLSSAASSSPLRAANTGVHDRHTTERRDQDRRVERSRYAERGNTSHTNTQPHTQSVYTNRGQSQPPRNSTPSPPSPSGASPSPPRYTSSPSKPSSSRSSPSLLDGAPDSSSAVGFDNWLSGLKSNASVVAARREERQKKPIEQKQAQIHSVK